MKFLGNGVFFVITYVILMIPTYILPYFGSNSAIVNAAAAAAEQTSLQFILHLLFLIGLVVITWFRGKYVGQQWLVVIPFIALVFDLMPGLSVIPLVPTVMHILVIILGARATKQVVSL